MLYVNHTMSAMGSVIMSVVAMGQISIIYVVCHDGKCGMSLKLELLLVRCRFPRIAEFFLRNM